MICKQRLLNLQIVPTAAMLLLGGCYSGPRAPALQNETVYQNSQEGFRFLPPAGWTQQARAELPPGKVTERRLLVEYKCFMRDKPASLDVSMLDMPAHKPLADCVREQGGADGWHEAAPAEELDVGGRAAVRGAFWMQTGNATTIREVVAVRRRERVYFFTSVFGPGDTRSRDVIRKAVATVSW